MKQKNDLVVFVIDGSSLCRYMYQKHMINLGFSEVHTFENATQCLSETQIVPDVIVLDFDAIPENSFRVVDRAKLLNPNLRVIIISAQKDIKVLIEAFRVGVSGYVMKDENQLDMMRFETNRILNQIQQRKAV